MSYYNTTRPPSLDDLPSLQTGTDERSSLLAEAEARIAALEAELDEARKRELIATEAAKNILRDLGDHLEPFCDEMMRRKLATAEERVAEYEDKTVLLERALSDANCLYAGGGLADSGGSHCPVDAPCYRCRAERAEEQVAEMENTIKQLRSIPPHIDAALNEGDGSYRP